jgi:hypothetical protein
MAPLVKQWAYAEGYTAPLEWAAIVPLRSDKERAARRSENETSVDTQKRP